MSAVSRWASMRPEEPSNVPNPYAGFVIGYPHGSRPNSGATSMPNQNSGSDWHPTVVNLLVLIILELLAYGLLRSVFNKALG